MSQTAAAPPPAASPARTAAAPPPATRPQSGRAAVQVTPGPQVSRTPQQLRRLSLAVLWLGIVFGIAGAVSFVLLGLALGRAGDSTAQLIRVQQIQTSLLTADASATNAFLVGGLEPRDQRAAYDQAIDTASSLIAQAGRAEPADEQALGVLNEQLVAYAAGIEQARANNRQGFPVGAQYLRVASSTLRAEALPVLDNLVKANAARAAGQMDTNEAWLFGVVGFACVAALVAAQVWVARRFRRTVNPFLLAGSAAALATWLVLIIAVSNVARGVSEVREDTYARVNAAATARIAAFDAKSNESLTLVARGSGASFEKAWVASAATVTANLKVLPGDVGAAWTQYARVHQQVRSLDDGGKWEDAVRLATSADKNTSNTTFASFDSSASAIVTADGTSATNVLRAQQGALIGAAVAALVIGVAAGVLCRRGVETRLREYR